MTQRSEEQLMRYLDGEATEEEAVEVERWLGESREARALAGDVEAVGAAVRAIAAEKSASFDIADAVMGAIEKERAPAPAAPRSLEAHREKKRGLLLPALGVSLAAAAAALFLLRAPAEGPRPNEPVARTPEVQPGAPVAEVTEVAVAADDGPGAAIEAVDFGAQNGTIFMVASGPAVTPVVWLVDDGEASEG